MCWNTVHSFFCKKKKSEEQNSKNYSKRKKMQPIPGKLYKIPKRKNKSFFIRKKMNKKPHKKNPCLCTLFGGYMLL